VVNKINRKQILVVEDEAIIALNIKNLLENLGYEICGLATSAEEAVQLAGEKGPDLILIDIILDGEIDGIDAVVEIKETLTLNMPIIYMTAHSDEKTLARAKATEPHGYILKPVNYNELRSTIEIVLHKYEMEEKLKAALEELEAKNKELLTIQNELMVSEKKYQKIFTMMIDGYVLFERIEGAKGVDFRFLEVNPAFENLTGLTRNVIGKTLKEVLSDIEDHWIESFEKVVLSGESIRFENYAAPFKKWFEISAYCPGEKQIAALFADITYRKKREE
jgi:CheY-like chemotaxis protein